MNPAEKYANLFVFSGGNKAGMEAMDKEKQAQVIYEMSKNSAFFKRACKLDEAADEKAEQLKKQYTEINGSLAQRLLNISQQKLANLEKQRCLNKICCVLDMDMFYAAVEIRDQPHLKDLPVAVGGAFMISTSNYVARKYGVRAAMPGFIAKKLCPHLVFVDTNFDKYKIVADQIRGIIKKFDPDFHCLSLDEVYFDLTDAARQRYWSKKGVDKDSLKRSDTNEDDEDEDGVDEIAQNRSADTYFVAIEQLRQVAVEILEEIRKEIKDVTGGLTSSAGIANNFFLAKIGADINKPDGQYELPPTRQAVLDFLSTLPTRKVGGIGKVMEKLLSKLDIHTVGDIHNNVHKLIHVFTPVTGDFLLRISMGIATNEGHEHEHRETSPSDDIGRKSIGCERTYTAKGIDNPREIFEKLHELCENVHKDLVEHQLLGRTVTLKLKDIDFTLFTRSQTHSYPIQSVQDIEMIGKQLLTALLPKKIRLLGINMSKLQHINQPQQSKSISSSSAATSVGSIFSSKLQKSMLAYCKGSVVANTTSSSGTTSSSTLPDNKMMLSSEEIEELLLSHEEESFEEVEELSKTISDEDMDMEVKDELDSNNEEEEVNLLVDDEKHHDEEKHLKRSMNAYDRLMTAAYERRRQKDVNSSSSRKRPLESFPVVKREATSVHIEENYFCPICGNKFDGNLTMFNAHIDKCLLLGEGEQPSKKVLTRSKEIEAKKKEDVITIDSSQDPTQPEETNEDLLFFPSNCGDDITTRSIPSSAVGGDDVEVFLFHNVSFVRKTDFDALVKAYHSLLDSKLTK